MSDDAKPKRKKGKLPGARTMEHMRKEGLVVAMVERRNPHAMIRQDLFGFADLIAMRPGAGIIAVQATSMGNRTSRITKIIAEPRAKLWLASGGRIQVWGWRKLTRGMVREKWLPEITEITLKDFAPDGSPAGVGEVRPPAEPGSLFDDPELK